MSFFFSGMRSRAQKAFMTIELDHGHQFTYSALMEFKQLRLQLQRLIVVSQLSCEELDNARLNILKEVQKSRQHLVNVCDLVPGSTYYAFDSDTQNFQQFVHQKRNEKKSKNPYRDINSSPIGKLCQRPTLQCCCTVFDGNKYLTSRFNSSRPTAKYDNNRRWPIGSDDHHSLHRKCPSKRGYHPSTGGP